MSRVALALSLFVAVDAAGAPPGKEQVSVDEITIKQGTVGRVNGLSIGVRWIDIADFTAADGTKRHELAAGLTVFPPERMLTAGKGSVIDLHGQHYEVGELKADASPARGSVTLRHVP